MATAALHNLSVLWNEDLPAEDDDEDEEEDVDDQEEDQDNNTPIAAGGNQATRLRVSLEGAAMRATLLANMPNPTPTEARRIRCRNQ